MSQFDDLPKIDPKDFEPPAWATSSRFHWDKGEGSSSSGPSYYQTPDSSLGQNADEYDGLDETLVDTDLGIQKVKEDLGGEAVYEFTTEELKKLSSKALKLKELGNKAFTSKTPHLEKALDSYTAALEFLPSCPKRSDKIETAPKEPSSGIIEVTDEEADTMREEEAKKAQRTPEDTEREDVEEAIRSCTAACWSNIAAVHAKRGDDAKAVAACDEALKIDPHHTRALTRRADANERIGTTSSLGKAQTDYLTLITLLPTNSPDLPRIRRVAKELEARIKAQQEKDMEEAIAKLKEMGNSFLGMFGMSTDMFQMEKQEGGGYTMNMRK